MNTLANAAIVLALAASAGAEPSRGPLIEPIQQSAKISFGPKDHQLIQRIASTLVGEVVYQGTMSGYGKGHLWIEASSTGAPMVTTSEPIPESYSKNRKFEVRAPLVAGLHSYEVKLLFVSNSTDGPVVLDKKVDVVVGDAFLISGQSNGVFRGDCPSPIREANNPGITAIVCPNGPSGFAITPTPTASQAQFVRTFGAIPWLECSSLTNLILRGQNDRKWHVAQDQVYANDGYVGAWPLAFAYRVLEAEQIPVAILNGCMGGSSIGKNQRMDSDPNNHKTIYGQLLNRYNDSGLGGIKAIFWHQGEFHRFDSPASDPCIMSGTVPTESVLSYQDAFEELFEDWDVDYPGFENVFVLQVRTEFDYLNDTGTNDMGGVFEAQRSMGFIDPRVIAQTTAGITLPPNDTGGINIHYDRLGYEEVALNAYSAAATTFPDYSLPLAKAFVPLNPSEARKIDISGTKYIEIEFDNDPLFHPLDSLTNDAATRERFLMSPAVVLEVEVVGGNKVRLRYETAADPAHITYRLFGADGPWIRSSTANYAFGFTIPTM